MDYRHPAAGLILLAFALSVAAVLLFLAHRTRAGRLVAEGIPDRPRRRLFLATIAFFVTFLGVRLLVVCITHGIGPFGWVTIRGRHIHHLVWGILMLLGVGYASVAEWGRGDTPRAILASRIIVIFYGIGAALTLDEFALWLNLEDVYWARQGRESIDAVVLFGALLLAGALGAPLLTRGRRSGGNKDGLN